MFALYGAFPLTQMKYVAIIICDDLNLNMLGILNILLKIQRRDNKCIIRFGCGLRKHLMHVDGISHYAHTPAATTRSGLNNYRISDLTCQYPGLFCICDSFTTTTGHFYATFLSKGTGLNLIAHGTDKVGRRANENKACLLTSCSKIGVFR